MQVALHMRATRTFTDRDGVTRKNGEEWLIKIEDTDSHIPDVYEEVSVHAHIAEPQLLTFTLSRSSLSFILPPLFFRLWGL